MNRLITTSMLTAGLLIAMNSFADSPTTSGATGLCKDGTTTSAPTKKGACRGHQGVKEWYATASAAAAPAAAPAAGSATAAGSTAGATGVCKDGTSTTAATKKGACRGHQGVKEWYAADAAPTASAPAAPKAAPTAASASVAGPTAGATGLCKDGTSTTAASKKGACRGHQGVKEWYAAASAPAAAAAAPSAPIAAPQPAASPAPAPVAPTAATTATPPKPATAPAATAAPGGGPGLVWANKSTKVYHCPSDRWYGKTKEGAYLSEADAKAQGYHADHGKACTQ